MLNEKVHDDFIAFIENENRDQYEEAHKVRYIETFSRIKNYIEPNHRILELGNYSSISLFLREKGCQISALTDDLRYSFDLPSDLFDVVLSLEVVEHLKDTHSSQHDLGEIAMFTFSGVNNMFRECFRILKPGGYLCLTTPNLCSIDAIGQIFLELHPFQYEPHVREFAPRDVILLGENCGFDAMVVETFDAWNPLPKIDRARIRELIEAEGFSTALRGDDLFIAFRKP